jgi:hypothetical protein
LSRFIKDKLQVNSLNISNINNSLSAANFLEKIHFGSYLAGLYEGDGHISISNSNSKVKNLSLSITFNIKDFPLCERLKEVIGFG